MRINFKVLWVFLFANALVFGFEDVDFDHSNGLDLLKKYSAKYLDPDSDEELQLLRDNYERLKPSKISLNKTPIIPKIIHQVWLGSTMPKNYQYYQETWRQYHPDWQIKIWSREDILKENFPGVDLFFLARSYAEQADIARYEIINRYGGLYIDTDVECFASFDDLHYKYDFYVNMEPPALNKKRVTIANNMIAAVPHHPVLAKTLSNIRSNWYVVEEEFEKNFSNSWTSFGRSSHNLAVQRTMYPLSDAVFDFLKSEDQTKYKSIILPSGYNIPMYVVNSRPIVNFLSNSFRGRAKLTNKIEIRPETMSFHFYDKLNSLMHSSDFSVAIFNQNKIKGFFYRLLKFRDKYYLAFRDLFNRNFTTEIEYSPKANIPKVIYINGDKVSEQKLVALKNQWQALNPGFVVKVMSPDNIQKFVSDKLNSFDSKSTKLLARFYLLSQNGGVFVEPSFRPAKLDEFHHKYAYYGMFSNLTKVFDPLKIDTKIIAFSSDHSILHNFIQEIEAAFLENESISDTKIRKIYLDNAYKYYQLDGKSIILPEVFFNQKR